MRYGTPRELRGALGLFAVLSFVAPLGAQEWQTPADHPGDPAYHQPDYLLAFVATQGHADEANGTPPHFGLDVLATSNPSAHGPAGGLYVLLPDGRVEKLFPLAAHENIPGLIDTPLGQLERGAVSEPSVSEDGRTLYFAYFHDATWEPSNGGFQSSRISFKGCDLYRLDLGPLVDDPDLDPAELAVRRLTFKQYTGPAKSNVMQTVEDRLEDAMNPDLAQAAAGTTYWGAMDMHLIELRTRSGLKALWVSNRARLMNSNDGFGEANHNFNLYLADILPDGSLGTPAQFQYYTTTSALSPTPLRNGLAFSYQSTTEESRRWDVQSIDSEGRWAPLIGYAHSEQLFHLGTLVVERDGAGELVDSYVGVKYYNLNNAGFGQLHRIRMEDAGTNEFVLGNWGTSPRQLSEHLTIGAISEDQPSPRVTVEGEQVYIGKFSSPRGGRLGGEYYMAYTPTSANVPRLDADGRANQFESELRYRPNLDPFQPHEPIDLGSEQGLYRVVRDASLQYDLIWPTPVLSWLERTGEAQQRVAEPIIDPESEIPAGMPQAEVGAPALWNSDIRPYDCYLLGSRPFNPNTLHSNEMIQVVNSQEGLRYVQDPSDFCQYLVPETVLGIGVNLTSQRTDFQFFNQRGYETDGSGKTESVEQLGFYSVLEQNEADQSFKVRIPANVPFEFHLIDRRYGMKLADVRSWHSLKPRETRTDCSGCHQHEVGFEIPFEGSEASNKSAFDLTQRTTYIDYDADCRPRVGTSESPSLATPEWKTDIWPGFDQHCGDCHSVIRSLDTDALLAFDYGTEKDAYDKLKARNYAGSELGALGSPAFWAAYGERTDGRDNDLPQYTPDYAAGQWGYRFSSLHATSPGLCAASNPEWASWVRLLGQWIDNHMPRDTGATPFVYKYDRYHPTVDIALGLDHAHLRVGCWDDRGTVELTLELNGSPLATFPALANGLVTVALPRELGPADLVRAVVRDPTGNRQVREKSQPTLLQERDDRDVADRTPTPPNTRPSVVISSPAPGSFHTVGELVFLSARASDIEDGNLDASLSWSSDREGALGAGASIEVPLLQLGVHRITARVTDSEGRVGSGDLVLTVGMTDPAPSAEFVGSPRAGVVPLLVAFTNLSTGTITGHAWTFGDGGTSSLASPSHSYTTPGTYTVSLTETGPGGTDVRTRTDYITVEEPAPIAQFVGSPTTGVAPLFVAFTNQSTGTITGHAWTFGDGGTSSLASPSHSYATPGTYTVSLTESGPGGSDVRTRTDYITVTGPGIHRIFVAAASAPSAVFAGEMSSSAAYATGDDLDPALDSLLPALVFADGTANDLTGTGVDRVQYTIDLPQAGQWFLWGRFYFPGASGSNDANSFWCSVDGGPLLNFGNNRGSFQAWHWDGEGDDQHGPLEALALGTLGAGTHVLSVSKREVVPIPPRLDVLLLTNDPGAPPTDAEALAGLFPDEPAPSAQFVGSPTTGAAPLSVTFTNQSSGTITAHAWTFGDGGTSSLASPSHSYATPGTYTVSLTESGPGGSDVRTRTDYVTVTGPGIHRIFVAAASAPSAVFAGEMRSSAAYAAGEDLDPALDSLLPALVFADGTTNDLTGTGVDRVQYTIDLPQTGQWFLWGRFYFPGAPGSNDANSFWCSVDDGPLLNFGNNRGSFQAWHWDGEGDSQHGPLEALPLGTLGAGTHVLSVSKREVVPIPPRLDVLLLTNDPDSPPTDAEALADLFPEVLVNEIGGGPPVLVPGAPIPLFDGRTLDGLRPWFSDSGFADPSSIFRIEDGLLHVTGKGWGSLTTTDRYQDYVLVLEYRWGEATWEPRRGEAREAGLLIHGHGREGGWNGRLLPSLQTEILEGSTGSLILLQGPSPMRGTGFAEAVACALDHSDFRDCYRWSRTGTPRDLRVIPRMTLHWSDWAPGREGVQGFRAEDVDSPHGDWNQLVVVAAGDTAEVFLNGVKVNEVMALAPTSGRIGLEVEFAEFFVRRWELLPLGAAVGPTVTSADLPRGVAGSPYSGTLAAVGGAMPTSWTLADGALPPGLDLDPASGSIAGAPRTAGSAAFVARVTDAQGLSAEGAFELEVLHATSVLPADGLVLQLESSEFTRAGPVSSWSDQSGRGNHVFARGDPAVAVGATPTGLPAIVLAGLEDQLERLHATHPLSGLPTGNADRSIFFVVRYDGGNASAGVAYGQDASNQAFGLMLRQPSGHLALQGLGPSQDLVSSTSGAGARWLTQSSVLAAGQARLFKGGAPIAQWTHTYDTALARLVIGAEIGGHGSVDLRVAALLIYDRALGESERNAVEAYLAGKYLIAAPQDGPRQQF